MSRKWKRVVDLGAVDGEQRLFTPAAANVERRGEIAAGDSGQHLEHAHGVIGQMRHALHVLAIEKGLAGARGREANAAGGDVDGFDALEVIVGDRHFGRGRRHGVAHDQPVAIGCVYRAQIPGREDLAQQLVDARGRRHFAQGHRGLNQRAAVDDAIAARIQRRQHRFEAWRRRATERSPPRGHSARDRCSAAPTPDASTHRIANHLTR